MTPPGEDTPVGPSAAPSRNLRAATFDDTDAILDVAVASTLFPAGEVEALREALAGVLEGKQGPDHQIAVWVMRQTAHRSVWSTLARI